MSRKEQIPETVHHQTVSNTAQVCDVLWPLSLAVGTLHASPLFYFSKLLTSLQQHHPGHFAQTTTEVLCVFMSTQRVAAINNTNRAGARRGGSCFSTAVTIRSFISWSAGARAERREVGRKKSQSPAAGDEHRGGSG